jgi:GDP-L-fucose synthase
MKNSFKKTVVFGSKGLLGSSLMRSLENSSLTESVIGSSRETLDLLDLSATKNFIDTTKPDLVMIAAAKVGGIVANNTKRVDFLVENLKINLNILESLIPYSDIRIINFGSSCIYPLDADNPIKESSILTGKLEPTNSPYAIAKLAAIELADSMQTQYGHKITNIMPTNLYGPGDNFSSENSHVIPGLISKMHTAKKLNKKSFKVWGSGSPLREFLHVDDLSNAVKFIISNGLSQNIINVGSGNEISIKYLAKMIANVVDFKGDINFDLTKPDGNPRKLIDSSYIKNNGWKPLIDLETGIENTYRWFLENSENLRTD